MKLKIKGINDGLLMTLPNLSWDECCSAVRDTIGANLGFYEGANLFLDAGDMDIRVVEITSLRNELESSGIHLKGIFSHSEKTMQNCISLGLMTEPAVSKRSFRRETIEEQQPNKGVGEQAYLVTRTVRSGTVIDRKETVVVLGDVNPGAEIRSGKNIIVIGTARGRLCAGNSGYAEAYIAASDFDDAQVMVNDAFSLIQKKDLQRFTADLFVVRNKYGEIEIETK